MEQQEMHFFGGPLDGLTFSLSHSRDSHSADDVPSEIGLPVNSSLLDFLFGDASQGNVHGPATSIAIYELQQEYPDPEVLHFRHLCSVAEGEYELENA